MLVGEEDDMHHIARHTPTSKSHDLPLRAFENRAIQLRVQVELLGRQLAARRVRLTRISGALQRIEDTLVRQLRELLASGRHPLITVAEAIQCTGWEPGWLLVAAGVEPERVRRLPAELLPLPLPGDARDFTRSPDTDDESGAAPGLPRYLAMMRRGHDNATEPPVRVAAG
mgnify:CR=1 FL=1